MERITFTLKGRRYELSRAVVESRLRDVAPEAIRKHAVRVNGIWYPAIQAFEVAGGVPRSEFISHTARRHLAALGFEVHGEIDSRTVVRTPAIKLEVDSGSGSVPDVRPPSEWHTEANVQAAIVTALAAAGWQILSVANTATKEHGVDVIAEREDQTVGVEVKGFPSRSYADSSRAHETKPTSPSTQAGHWFAQAVLAAMRLRGKEPAWRSAIALPDFPRYRDLHAATVGSLTAAQIEVWWVESNGALNLS
ncbi:hypothetical protein [Pengzhenrongella phosphoraccumulans]|uniref:hypothetical protein n=1 Tax=Pengzhenrongella phosphoraccumulans TaxID=3114394 RepID=UPI00388E723C